MLRPWLAAYFDEVLATIQRGRRQQEPVQLTLMDYSVLVRTTDSGPMSFPLLGLADLPKAERQLVLAILTTPPVNRWLDTSTVHLRPDSSFPVTHLEPPPQSLKALVPILA